MRFLVVVIAILLERTSDSLQYLQSDNWVRRWDAALEKMPALTKSSGVRLVVFLAVPVILMLLVVFLLTDRLFGLPLLLINLLVLLYSFGRGDLDHQVETYTTALLRGDEQAAFHDAAVFNTHEEEGQAVDWQDFHRETLQSLTYRFFERDMAAIFWFLLVGAPGALLYRLLVLKEENGPELAGRWLWGLEWVPVRLAGMTFALVGNFAGCLDGLRQCIVDFECSSGEVLRLCVEGALGESTSDETRMAPSEEALEVSTIQKLFNRALVFWVCVVAVLELFNIF